VKVLFAGHLKRVLSAAVHVWVHYQIIPAIRGIRGDALATIECRSPILLLDLIYEVKLLGVGPREFVLKWQLRGCFAFCTFFSRGHTGLGGDRQCDRIFQGGLVDLGLVTLLILTIVELVSDLSERLFHILRWCFYLNYYMPF
jgi:hypothetical protein